MTIRPINIFLTIMYAILCFCILITISYNLQIATLEKISNSFYGKDSLYFTISNTTVDYKILYDKLPVNSILYSQLPSSNDIRGVIYKGNCDHPAIKQGRFLCSKDFVSANSKMAVIGSKVPVSFHNGNQYFEFDGESYKVVGIMGYSMPTKLDKTVMLSLNADLLKLPSQYILGGQNSQINYQFLGNETLLGKVYVFDKKPANILHIVNTGINQKVTSILFILILFFNTFILSFLWLERKSDEMVIKKMNGFNNYHIFKDLNWEFGIINIIGLLIGTLISCLFGLNGLSINVGSLIISYALILLASELYFFIIARPKLIELNNRKLGVLN